MSGTGQLAVGRRPRVAIVTTGDELVQPGRPLAPGQIPDSNGVMLAAMLAGEVAAAVQPHHLPDDRANLASALKELARRHHVIVSVGGASGGDPAPFSVELDDPAGGPALGETS